MFYSVRLQHGEGKTARALVAFTPAESKRLIAKAVAVLPEVRKALEKGTLIIARGTTNAFVAEEILGVRLPKERYAAGLVYKGELGVGPREGWLPVYVLKQGKPVETSAEEALRSFGPEDVFLKGANAIDPQGNAGILVASDIGGTIGSALHILLPRGAHLIMPVGLEKLVPSVLEAAEKCDIHRFRYVTGLAAALFPVVTAKVVTEIQALAVLCGVQATHVASGGIGGSEGTVVLSLEGGEEAIDKAVALIKGIKGELPVPYPIKV